MNAPIRIEDEIQFLDAKGLQLRRNSFGELVAEFADGSVQSPVSPARSFPLSGLDEFIVLLGEDGKEVGIIEHMNQMKKADRKLLEEELDKCYFTPKIDTIHSIDSDHGVMHWEVGTDRGHTDFDLRSRRSLLSLPGGRVFVKDVDGNRYEIPNYHRLDPKSMALLEPLI